MSAPEGVQPTSDARASIARGERRALLSTCVAAAARAAELIRRHAANLEAVTWEVKSQADFVSNADREAETAITALITERHADARITWRRAVSRDARPARLGVRR